MTTFVEVKTADLIGPALDWAVAHAVKAWESAHELFPTMTLDPTFSGVEARPYPRGEYETMLQTCVLIPNNPFRQDPQPFCPSTDWSQGGPLISNYRVSIIYSDEDCDPCAWTDDTAAWHGPTPLIAACRAIVAAKLGDVVQVPAELVGSCVASDHDVPSAAQPRCRECDDRICNGTGVYEGRKTGIVGNQVARKFVCQDDQREVDELVALGIEQEKREIERLRAEVEALRKDKARLDAIEQECWDVRFLSSPNGDAGDSSVSIEIVGHFEAKPCERVIGENYHENLRAAIDQAMTADAYPPARPEYEDPEDWDDLFPVGSGNKSRRRAEALGIDYDAAMAAKEGE